VSSTEPPPEPGVAVLVIRMPGGMETPTDTVPAMIAWLFRHGGPRTGEVLRRLQRHGWTLELSDPAAWAQSELWASARFPDAEQARAAARPFQGRVDELMRWTAVDGSAETMTVDLREPES
jgi:hypothetical protein